MTQALDTSVERIDDANIPGVVTIRLNRPEVRNALAPRHMLLVASHLFDCQHDPAVKAVFLQASLDVDFGQVAGGPRRYCFQHINSST
jgi:enoyl-CoA hydratase/carnithine racemase